MKTQKQKQQKKLVGKQALKIIDKETHKAAKVVERAMVRQSSKTTESIKRGFRNVPRSLLKSWALALALPFEHRSFICPVNFNPTPTLMCTTATTTYNATYASVPATSTVQWVFYPGHGPSVPSSASTTDARIATSMDGTAYHSIGRVALSGGGTMTVGPIGMTTADGATAIAAGCVTFSGVGLGSCTNDSTTGNLAGWDESLPYAYGGTTPQDAAHVRWQLVSMAVRFVNTTPAISRGGSVTSVQLVNSAGIVKANGQSATAQGQLEHNPSYKLHGICDELTEVAWTPRVNDLAYWHAIVPPSYGDASAASVTNKYNGAGMVLFFNNSTSSAQSYSVQVIYNWMIAGNYLASVSAPAVTEPILRSPIEQTIVHLQNTSSTAAHAPSVAEAATTSINESEGMVSKLARAGFDGLVDAAHRVGGAFVKEAANRVSQAVSHKLLYPGMPNE